MKKLLFALLLPATVYAGTPKDYEKKPIEQAVVLNAEIESIIDTSYHFVKCDSQSADGPHTKQYVYSYRSNKAANNIVSIAYKVKDNANPDLNDPGKPTVYSIEIQGHFLPLLALYNKWTGLNLVPEEVSNDGKAPYNRDGSKLLRINKEKGIWYLKI